VPATTTTRARQTTAARSKRARAWLASTHTFGTDELRAARLAAGSRLLSVCLCAGAHAARN
jgi:hypothetical protein